MQELMMEKGERSATFLIRVNKKPNEPWQGNVIWRPAHDTDEGSRIEHSQEKQ